MRDVRAEKIAKTDNFAEKNRNLASKSSAWVNTSVGCRDSAHHFCPSEQCKVRRGAGARLCLRCLDNLCWQFVFDSGKDQVLVVNSSNMD